MDDIRTRLNAAIKRATDDYRKDAAFQNLAKSICDTMTDMDNTLRDIFSNLPLSRRERRRMEKAERQKALKARKRK